VSFDLAQVGLRAGGNVVGEARVEHPAKRKKSASIAPEQS
jgi:hypothetical protein